MFAKEPEFLRSELHFLKNCQVRYLLISLTAAGAIMAFAEKLQQNEFPEYVFLAPLLIVLPCWWIFFDKATSITRIVGYYRVLEVIELLDGESPYRKVGWENSLSQYRSSQTNRKTWRKVADYVRGIAFGLYSLLVFTTSKKYWVLNWLTFFAITAVFLTLSYPASLEQQVSLWHVFAGIGVVTFVHNLGMLGQLTRGVYSYEQSFIDWKELLRKDPMELIDI